MRRVFADAGYWIALLNPKDGLHAKAKAVSAALGRSRIVTSEMVLTEVRRVRSWSGFDRTPTDVIPMTSNAFREAVGRYRGRVDKTWGLTDCTSFLIMEQTGITDALSADRDFQQAGFKTLLLD